MDRGHATSGLAPRHDSSARVQKMEPPADRMAALKARVSAAIGNSKAKGGLNVGLHPALEDLGQWRPSAQGTELKSSQPSSATGATVMPGTRPRLQPGAGAGVNTPRPGAKASTESSASAAVRHNPYLDEAAAPQGGAAAAASRQRQSRQLVFNQKGKYIQQANALRRQAALEDMKRRIAQQTRKAGIDEDADVEKNFQTPAPPDVEWWDEALVGTDYETASPKIETPDSIITEYIQHPVALEPPQEQQIPPARTMYLTPKEQAKLRRQRRMADLKEKQAKIRLGLEPAPPPKVKKGNLMRVLGEEAVKDPTAVEARVNREIAERRQKHLQANEERKLTTEQRHDKLAANQEKDAARGVYVLVLRIDSLANGQHRYKIGKNAEQWALTGVCILHPRFNLVVVEGGRHSIAQYKKLMLNRIDWTENAPSRERETSRESATVRQWLVPEDEKGVLKDLSANKCALVFEGEVKARGFRKWGSRVCETDAEAREVLARAKMENFWSQAKAA